MSPDTGDCHSQVISSNAGDILYIFLYKAMPVASCENLVKLIWHIASLNFYLNAL